MNHDTFDGLPMVEEMMEALERYKLATGYLLRKPGGGTPALLEDLDLLRAPIQKISDFTKTSLVSQTLQMCKRLPMNLPLFDIFISEDLLHLLCEKVVSAHTNLGKGYEELEAMSTFGRPFILDNYFAFEIWNSRFDPGLEPTHIFKSDARFLHFLSDSKIFTIADFGERFAKIIEQALQSCTEINQWYVSTVPPSSQVFDYEKKDDACDMLDILQIPMYCRVVLPARLDEHFSRRQVYISLYSEHDKLAVQPAKQNPLTPSWGEGSPSSE